MESADRSLIDAERATLIAAGATEVTLLLLVRLNSANSADSSTASESESSDWLERSCRKRSTMRSCGDVDAKKRG